MNSVREIYSLLPDLDCQGLCQDSCGPIGMSDEEWAVLGPVECDETQTCPLLIDGACSRYQDRPLICRLWGIDESMACPYGCVPASGHLSEDLSANLLQIALQIGGGSYTKTSRH